MLTFQGLPSGKLTWLAGISPFSIEKNIFKGSKCPASYVSSARRGRSIPPANTPLIKAQEVNFCPDEEDENCDRIGVEGSFPRGRPVEIKGIKKCTLCKTNIFAPGRWWLEGYFPFGMAYFYLLFKWRFFMAMLVLGSVAFREHIPTWREKE